MLKNRVLETLWFFALFGWAPTLLELHRFLLADAATIKSRVDLQGEIIARDELEPESVPAEILLRILEVDCEKEVENFRGFYFLKGQQALAENRLSNYYFGIAREKLISRFTGGLRHVPFVRGVALAGSQVLGEQKENSDIDLFIITDPQFMWLARTLVTAYFQILGLRRHGGKIANRFCLNHYLAGAKPIKKFKNLYTAFEYAKLRPLINSQNIFEFQHQNRQWINCFFPNWRLSPEIERPVSRVQKFLEKILSSKFGGFLETICRAWQLPKIRKEKFIVVDEGELSFHPNSKQQKVLDGFFKSQK